MKKKHNVDHFIGTSTGSTSTSTIHFSHNNSSSNNNNMNSSNLNLTMTHNGFGFNHGSINQTHQNHQSNHFNSNSNSNANSVLTFRSNRRSVDRSDNKNSDTISSSSIRNTLPCNDPIQERLMQTRSYFNSCMRILYKMLLVLSNGFRKRRPTTINNPNNKFSEQPLFRRILSMYRNKAGADLDENQFNRSISNDSSTEQSSYIERVDDGNGENIDLMANTTVTKVSTSAPSAHVPVELSTGNKIFAYECC